MTKTNRKTTAAPAAVVATASADVITAERIEARGLYVQAAKGSYGATQRYAKALFAAYHVPGSNALFWKHRARHAQTGASSVTWQSAWVLNPALHS